VSSSINITKQEHIELGILENGDLFLSDEAVAPDSLPQRYAAEAAKEPQLEVPIRADRHAYYEQVTMVMAFAAKAGLVRIGFVSEPNTKNIS
jgi:biopolymer transport protein ExbD